MSHSSKYIYAVIFRINFNTSNTVNTRKKSCLYQENEKLYLIYYFHHIRHKFSFVLQWTDWKIIFLFSLKKKEKEKKEIKFFFVVQPDYGTFSEDKLLHFHFLFDLFFFESVWLIFSVVMCDYF